MEEFWPSMVWVRSMTLLCFIRIKVCSTYWENSCFSRCCMAITETVSVLKHTLEPAEKCSLIVPNSILSLNWNLAPIPLYASLCPFTREGFLCFIPFDTGFCLLGFLYIHDGIYFHFSFQRKNCFCLCSWMCCFLSAIGAWVKNAGRRGWNSLTKISYQMKMAERIRYLSVAAIYKIQNLNVCSQVHGRVPYPAERASHLDSRGSGPFRSAGQQTGVCGSSASAESKQ